MTCIVGNGIAICRPKPMREKKVVLYCPKCKKRRRVIMKFFEWYGPHAICRAIRKRWKRVFGPCNYGWQFE